MIALLCALASGALFYLSLGLDDLWFLAWAAPAPIAWLAYGKTPGWQVAAAAFAAFAAGLGYVFECYQVLMPAYLLALFILPGILSFVAAVLFGRFAQRRLPPIAALFAFPAAFTALEFGLSSLWRHGSILSIANSQVSAPIVIQSASLLGPWAITFLICLGGNALAFAATRAPRALVAALAGVAICAANAGFGALRLNEPQDQTVRIAALSDNADMVRAYRAKTVAAATALAGTYAAAIRAAAAQGATLAVTPEGGMLSTRASRATVFAPLYAAANDAGIRIVAGVVEDNPAGDLSLLFAKNAPLRSYAKRHLFPGLEDNPAGDLSLLFAKNAPLRSYAKRHLFPGLEDRFTPGTTSGVFGGGLATAICKDMDFPHTLRADARLGITLMAVPASDFVHDGWLHARVAILRGVENGFALVRAANQGVDTISDAEGRVLARKTSTVAGMTMIVADVPLGTGQMLYTRIGDIFAWSCLVLTLVLATAAFLLGRAGRPPTVRQ